MSIRKNELIDNPFSKSLTIDAGQLIFKVPKRGGFGIGENNDHLLNEKERFLLSLFDLQNRLIYTIEQISSVIIYLRRYPLKQFYSKNNIEQLDYIQYHTEVYTHKVHTIKEVMLLMINDLYNLSLPPGQCSWNNITSKLSTDIQSLKIINQYFYTFEKVINARHLNTHRAIYQDNDHDRIESYRMLETIDLGEFQIKPDLLVKHATRKLRKERVAFIDRSLTYIYSYTREFLISLNEQYIMRMDNFSSGVTTA